MRSVCLAKAVMTRPCGAQWRSSRQRCWNGNRERVQIFEGTVISLQGSGTKEKFTVRRMAHGVGVERGFLVHSPRIDRIDVVRHGKVRRAKLYYLRGKVGKSARIREKRQAVAGSAPAERPATEETAETAES